MSGLGIKAPCGELASLQHFKDCNHAECSAKYKEFKTIQSQSREIIQRFWSKKD